MRNATTPQDALARDFRNVVNDSQELLKTLQSEGEAKAAEMKGRISDSLDTARVRLAELGSNVKASASAAAKQADDYVQANPWKAVGIGAAVGAIVGILVARR